MVKHIFQCYLIVLLLFIAGTAVAAKIEVATDRTQIQDNESFTLEFSSDSSVDDDPDFSPLEKNFHIISRSQSSNIQFINGRMDRQMSWVLVLMPKAKGNFSIPAIHFGSDKSEPLSIKVVEAKSDSNNQDELVYMEAFTDTTSAYVQSQVLYTLRIYHAVRFRNASLSELELSDKDAVIEKLEENKKYSKFINGRRYQVFEKRFAIFPQKTGELLIEPALLDAQFVESMRTLRNKRIKSKRLKVDVKPVPEIIRNKKLQYWLPAKELKLTEQWSGAGKDSGQLEIGEPLTRTVTLTATGLMSPALPDMSVNLPVKGMKHYPDQAVLDNKIVTNGYEGKRTEKIAYIPSKTGAIKLPKIELFWWDTKNNVMQKAVLPSRVVTVTGSQTQGAGGGAQQQNNDVSISTDDQQGESSSASTNNEMGASGNTLGVAGGTRTFWFWVSVLFFILWVATAGLWLRSRRSGLAYSNELSDTQRASSLSSDAIKPVKIACNNNDPAQAKEALLSWGQSIWSDDLPTSLGHLAKKVDGKLAQQINALNSVLYKPGESRWDAAALWESLQAYVEDQKQKEKARPSKLKPLFRLAASQEG